MLNHIVVMGRLTRDPELRRTQTGTAVTSFTVAVDRDFKDKVTGEKACDFIPVTAWRQTGEFVANHFTKGSMAVVDGRLQMRKWEDMDGNKRESAEIVANNVYFGDSKRDANGEKPTQRAQSSAQGHNYATGGEFKELTDDDGSLPF